MIQEKTLRYRLPLLGVFVCAGLSVSLSATTAPTANVRAWNGETLRTACGSSPRRPARPACAAYVAGVIDADAADRRFLKIAPWVCLGDASGRQAAEAVRAYLGLHPERRADDAASMALTALAEIYPCAPTR